MNSNDVDLDALPFLGWNQRDIHILCLGYLRNMLSNRIYNVDDVGSIVFKYLRSLTVDFMTIYNREYLNINIEIDKNPGTKTHLLCNFKTETSVGHYYSTMILLPQLSKIFEYYSICRMNVKLITIDCNDDHLKDGGYWFQCGIMAVKKNTSISKIQRIFKK